jgi:hypothetical protein
MMNMMNRMVEGRGHQREIDMLLELTLVFLAGPNSYTQLLRMCPENKLKAEQFVLSATQLPGLSKVSCVTSAPKSNAASQSSGRRMARCYLVGD